MSTKHNYIVQSYTTTKGHVSYIACGS